MTSRLDRSLLVVEDGQSLVNSVQSVLDRAAPGTRVWKASTLAEAYEVMRSKAVDVVVVDRSVDDASGLEVLRGLAEVKPKPVSILLVAEGDVDLLVEAINRARVDHVLLKPFEGDKAAAIFRALLGEQRGRPGRIPPYHRRLGLSGPRREE